MKNTVDTEKFLMEFAENFDSDYREDITMGSKFRDLPEWSSLQALVVISAFQEQYAIAIAEDELRRAETVLDLYALVVAKIIG